MKRFWRGTLTAVMVVASIAACGDDDDDSGQDVMTDSQILAVTAAINQGEIDQANAAEPKLTDDDARGYADTMLSEHTDALEEQSDLGITPEENATSTQLRANSAQVVARLQADPAGVAFDRTYIQTQIDGHSEALNIIDTMLRPSVDDNDVESYLDDLRDHVVEHLDDARDVIDDID